MTRLDLRRRLARAERAPQPLPTDAAADDTQQLSPSEPPRRNRRRVLAVATVASALVLGGGAVAVADAHKSVTLDVNGELVEVATFSGTVAAVLEAEGITVGERDLVAPAVDTEPRDGGEIVVRHARQVTVLTDGVEETVWTTALQADEALASLEARGQDVRLVASRSAAAGRAQLPVRIDGPAAVVVDGRTEQVAQASDLESLLTELDVTVGELDRVHVTSPAEGPLTVTVQRVVAEEQVTLTEVPFESVVEQSADLFVGQTRTAQAGAPGERTTVHRVVLVDGVEESRMLLSDAVTRLPVTEVVRQGTKERPVVAPRAAAAPAGGGGAAPAGDVWAALAQCESGGNPTIVSRNGLYHGLYQFSVGTWQSVGGSGLPSQASAQEQTERAMALQARSGWGQWPACSSKLGLR
ncbi:MULTISPECIES: resuscitation-promoting factor [unclassified Actinotalea]|uniref:resuscitation-promoting factor n=1 Tax=unclassified Actinotalea TaxID=2638618 RepID=UPI002715281C|nr:MULTISPECIES: resuscitation-promoting factor [unclassified Actinotalea]